MVGNKKIPILVAVLTTLILNLFVLYLLTGIFDVKKNLDNAHSGILFSQKAYIGDLEFINKLKIEADFEQDIQILIGPYKILHGNNFKYRLEQHLVFVEQSQTMKETFLILFDETFYKKLNPEERKAIISHELHHIYALAKRLIKPRIKMEEEADNYALKYVSIDTMMDICLKYEGDDYARNLRIENLKRQKITYKPDSTN